MTIATTEIKGTNIIGTSPSRPGKRRTVNVKKVLQKEAALVRLSAIVQFAMGKLNRKEFEELAKKPFPRLVEKSFSQISQVELANFMDISYGGIQGWLRGTSYPVLPHFLELVRYIGLSSDEVLEYLFDKKILPNESTGKPEIEEILKVIPNLEPENTNRILLMAADCLYRHGKPPSKENPFVSLSSREKERLKTLFTESLATNDIRIEEVQAQVADEVLSYIFSKSQEVKEGKIALDQLGILAKFCCHVREWINVKVDGKESFREFPLLNCKSHYLNASDLIEALRLSISD